MRSVFTRSLVPGVTTGEADLDSDGDISTDERPKKQENIEGRIIIARNIHWGLPAYMQHAIQSPVALDRLTVLEGLAHLHRVGNDLVRAEVIKHTRHLIRDDSKAVSAAAMKLMATLDPATARREAEEHAQQLAEEQARHEINVQAWREANEQARRKAEQQARREAHEQARRREEAARRAAEKQVGEQDVPQEASQPPWILPVPFRPQHSVLSETLQWKTQIANR
jgi:hypothetical protein